MDKFPINAKGSAVFILLILSSAMLPSGLFMDPFSGSGRYPQFSQPNPDSIEVRSQSYLDNWIREQYGDVTWTVNDLDSDQEEEIILYTKVGYHKTHDPETGLYRTWVKKGIVVLAHDNSTEWTSHNNFLYYSGYQYDNWDPDSITSWSEASSSAVFTIRDFNSDGKKDLLAYIPFEYDLNYEYRCYLFYRDGASGNEWIREFKGSISYTVDDIDNDGQVEILAYRHLDFLDVPVGETGHYTYGKFGVEIIAPDNSTEWTSSRFFRDYSGYNSGDWDPEGVTSWDDYSASCSFHIGDFDADGTKEVLIYESWLDLNPDRDKGFIYLFDGVNHQGWIREFNGGISYMLEDVDGDNKLELVIYQHTGFYNVPNGQTGNYTYCKYGFVVMGPDNSTEWTSAKHFLDYAGYNSGVWDPESVTDWNDYSTSCTFFSGDYDNDGNMEVLVYEAFIDRYPLPDRSYAYLFDGKDHQDWVREFNGIITFTLNDVDSDGVTELMIYRVLGFQGRPNGDDGFYVYVKRGVEVINPDNSTEWTSQKYFPEYVGYNSNGWDPQAVTDWNEYSSSCTFYIDDLDGDGDSDVFVQDSFLDRYPDRDKGCIYIFNGKSHQGWIREFDGSISYDFYDLDSDGVTELVTYQRTGFSKVSISEVDHYTYADLAVVVISPSNTTEWTDTQIFKKYTGYNSGVWNPESTADWNDRSASAIFEFGDWDGDGNCHVLLHETYLDHYPDLDRGYVYVFDGKTHQGWVREYNGTISYEIDDLDSDNEKELLVYHQTGYGMRDAGNDAYYAYCSFSTEVVDKDNVTEWFSQRDLFDYAYYTSGEWDPENHCDWSDYSCSWSIYVSDMDGDGNIEALAYDSLVDLYPDQDRGFFFMMEGLDCTSPAIIGEPEIEVKDTQAVITWKTNELSNSTVDYRFNSRFDNSANNNSWTKEHSITLTDLEPYSTYDFRIRSWDKQGNGPAEMGLFSFMTTDHVSPFVVSHTPSNNEVDVSTLSEISIGFSEIINSSRIQSSISITPNLDYFWEWDLQNLSLVLQPKFPLRSNLTYTVSLGQEITDRAGNPLEPLFSFEFTVEKVPVPSIQVINPLGGEIWEVGTVKPLKWSTQGGTGSLTVDLYCSFEGKEGYYAPIAEGLPSHQGVFNWTVPDNTSMNCFIRAVVTDGEWQWSTSENQASFEITDVSIPQLAVEMLSPGGEETYHKDDICFINWSVQGGFGTVGVDLYLSTNGLTGDYFPLAGNLSDTGSFSWKVPGLYSDNCHVQIWIQDSARQIAQWVNNEPFSIKKRAQRPEDVASIVLEPQEKTVYIGQMTPFTVNAYGPDDLPVSIPDGEINWSFQVKEGLDQMGMVYSNGSFVGRSPGWGLVVAEVYGQKDNARVTVEAPLLPTVIITEPENGTEVKGSVEIKGLYYYSTQVKVSIDYGKWIDLAMDEPEPGNGSWSHILVTDDLTDGEHVFQTRSTDGTDISQLMEIFLLVNNTVITDPGDGGDGGDGEDGLDGEDGGDGNEDGDGGGDGEDGKNKPDEDEDNQGLFSFLSAPLLGAIIAFILILVIVIIILLAIFLRTDKKGDQNTKAVPPSATDLQIDDVPPFNAFIRVEEMPGQSQNEVTDGEVKLVDGSDAEYLPPEDTNESDQDLDLLFVDIDLHFMPPPPEVRKALKPARVNDDKSFPNELRSQDFHDLFQGDPPEDDSQPTEMDIDPIPEDSILNELFNDDEEIGIREEDLFEDDESREIGPEDFSSIFVDDEESMAEDDLGLQGW